MADYAGQAGSVVMPVERLNYLGIADDITARIKSGEYPVGSQLPSVTALQELYSVGRSTIVRAMGLLHDRGLIYGEQGRGTFVRAAPPAG